MKSKLIQVLLLAGASLAGASILGCSDAEKPHNDMFAPSDQVKQLTKLVDAQRSKGDRADATLYDAHFDGAALTSLGMVKLDYMLDADRNYPVVVYLGVPDDTQLADRRASVQNYLMDRGGLHADQVRVEAGPNPASFAPVAPSIKNMDRTDSGETAAATTAAPASSGH